MRDRSPYDDTVQALEAEVLHLNALKTAQEHGSEAEYAYQQRINLLTSRSLALQAARPELRDYDTRIHSAARHARRLDDDAERAINAAWSTVKVTGGAGLAGLLICFIWDSFAPLPILLPVVTGLMLVIAVFSTVLALRNRPSMYAEADNAHAVTARLELERQAVLAQAEAGHYTPPMMRTAVAERVAPEPMPEPRQPLRLVPVDRDGAGVQDAEVVDDGRDSARDDW